MTSKRINKIYVWVQVQGEPVIAGAFEQADRVGTFYYADSFVENAAAWALDPVNLPLLARTDFHTRSNGGIFGVLLDAGPDSWGQRVLSAYSPSQPRTPLEFLLAGNGESCGALLFSLSRAALKRPSLMGSPISLELLEQAAQQLMEDRSLPAPLQEALLAGSSLGGARPKAAVVIEAEPWMAKFSKVDDLYNEVLAEKACLDMAATLGFDTPQSKVLRLKNGRDVLLTRRFDFDANGHKLHYISANSLLNLHRVSPDNPDHGYPGLADQLRKLEQGQELARELYRRMSFRVLIGDTDDHGRNHGFLYVDGVYCHAPVFDALPHLNTQDYQAMPIGKQGRARTLSNLISAAARFGVSQGEAREIVGAQQKLIRQWRDFFGHAGVSNRDMDTLAPCFEMAMHRLDDVGQERETSLRPPP